MLTDIRCFFRTFTLLSVLQIVWGQNVERLTNDFFHIIGIPKRCRTLSCFQLLPVSKILIMSVCLSCSSRFSFAKCIIFLNNFFSYFLFVIYKQIRILYEKVMLLKGRLRLIFYMKIKLYFFICWYLYREISFNAFIGFLYSWRMSVSFFEYTWLCYCHSGAQFQYCR